MSKPASVFAHIAYWLVMISLLVVAIGRDLSQPAAPPGYNKEDTQPRHETDTRDPKGEGGKSFWERTTDDPVAFFTLWLAIFTAVLSASTIGLWVVSLRAGRQQSADMANVLAVAQAQAKAAADQARVASQQHAALQE